MAEWTGLEQDNPAGIQNVDFMTLAPRGVFRIDTAKGAGDDTTA